MGSDDSQEESVAIQRRVDRVARLPAMHTKIDSAARNHRQPREKSISELTEFCSKRGCCDGRRVRRALKNIQHVFIAPRLQFLQRDDIGIQLGDDAGDALRIVSSITTDAAMNVIRRDS